MAFDRSSKLVAVHLTGTAPSLNALLEVVALPDIELDPASLVSPSGINDCPARDQNERKRCGGVSDIALDTKGQRLAVALAPPHPAAGAVAVFCDLEFQPSVSASLVGFLRPWSGMRPTAQSEPLRRQQQQAVAAQELPAAESMMLEFCESGNKPDLVLSIVLHTYIHNFGIYV